MKLKRYLLKICLWGMLLSAAFPGRVFAQVLFYDGFQQFATGTDLTQTSYKPSFGPATCSVMTSNLNGPDSITVSNFLGNAWAYFNNSHAANQNQYQGILSTVQSNQPLLVTWNMWIQATNPGPGMFMFSVPTSDSNANYNPPISFTDHGSIIALTNGTNVQVPIGNWGSLASTVMTNALVLNYPGGTFSYSLNGQTLATLPLGPYFTNIVGAIYFTGFERSPGSYGNRFAIANVNVEMFMPSNNFAYIITNNTITITRYTGTNAAVIIPDTINGLPVTSIGNFAFENKTGVTNVTIPGSVTSIGSDAFLGSGLTSVAIGGGVTNLGSGAFAFCSSLTNVMVSGSVDSIGGIAFAVDISLKTIYFQGNAPGVDPATFAGTVAATVYYVPGTTGWSNSFGGLPAVPRYLPGPVILGNGLGVGVKTNGFGFTVSWATNLSIIVEATTNIADLFWTPLATNKLSNGFFNFIDPQWTNYSRRFYRLAGTNVFTFFTASPPNGVAPLAVQFNSSNIDSLGNPVIGWHWNFGDGTTGTAQNPLHTYTNVGIFNPGFTATNSQGGLVTGYGPQITTFSFLTTTNNGAMTITGSTGTLVSVLTIPNTISGLPVTRIGPRAFFFCPRLVSVTIPDTVTSIGGNAFNACGNLSSVVIGNSVTNIESFAFAFDASLTGLTIPNSVITIGTNAFGYCSGLTSIAIPNSVASIGDFAFGSCGGLTNVVFGSGITNIGNLAFTYCTNLTGITIPGNVSSIGNSAFAACSSLVSVAIGGGTIGDLAFSSCANLSNVVIGSSVTRIGNFAFTFCANLTGFTIPENVASIGIDAFAACSNLTSVAIGSGNIGDYAFRSCRNLSDVMIGNSVTNIGVGAFAGCVGLTNIMIPGGVTGIGGGAFQSCVDLLNITIGAGVSVIGYGAFASSSNLQAVYFRGNPPTLKDANGVFSGVNPAVAKIYCLPGTTGWIPQVLTGDGNFGVRTNQFGFNFSCGNNLSVIVQASTSLNNPIWIPVATNLGPSHFSDSQWMNYPVRFYRLQAPSFGGLPIVLWNPVIQTGDGHFGVWSNQFGFTITGTANIPVVIQACTNLATPGWTPLFTGTLTNGSLYFSDPAWITYPGRFYRISSY
jgi:hypothetical protein